MKSKPAAVSIAALLSTLLCLTALNGCGEATAHTKTPSITPALTATVAPTPTPEPTATVTPTPTPASVSEELEVTPTNVPDKPEQESNETSTNEISEIPNN